ncbi:TetR/AcrR family transcriptional regulator [Catenuloplanes atrovinosus]|uniref:AcrR family transcriptional regulator n=1 Tax=Catenuloplanes atrovinosus TaxID=137266 RepID=A0AAE3YKD6_9ACTN|nr:TetR/AcrR family transcriptional regulator [Catenuloplanes atrovinosus]MDR7274127.1 AcrR family transcriptional regulator [Catenuloplanes atrovinosus]
MIIRTTLPLVAEFGAKVTTAQVARAAGIAEGTIFRVFADKDELLTACMSEALQPDAVHADIAAISLDAPLADRLVEATETLSAYVTRIGTITGALHATGFRPGDPSTSEAPAPDESTSDTPTPGQSTSDEPTSDAPTARPAPPPGGRERAMMGTIAALAELFEPEVAAGTLRRSPTELATALFGMLTVLHRPGLPGPPSATDLVDLFLYGAVTREEKS